MACQLTFARSCLPISHFGTIHWNGFLLIAVSASVGRAAGISNVSEANLADFGVCAAVDTISTDSFVDDGVVVSNDVIVDNGRVVVDLFAAVTIDPIIMAVVVPSPEVAAIDEGVVVVSESEAESSTDT